MLGNAIAVDGSGNVYTAGVMSNGSADLDPGPGTVTLTNLSGNADTYLSKLDAGGNYLWAGKFTNNKDIAAGVWPADIAVDSSQNIYVTGIYVGQVDFDPGVGVQTKTTVDDANRSGDAYVAKVTAAGGLGYFVSVGSVAGREDGYGIAVDGSGAAYVAGEFSSTASITTANGTVSGTLTSAGGFDAYALKLTPTGGLAWSRQWGSAGSDSADELAYDGTGAIYVTGLYSGTVSFVPGPALTSAGVFDVFVLRLGTDGAAAWSVSMGGADADLPTDIAVNGNGDVFTAGRYAGTADFDPSPTSAFNLTSAGDYDGFLSKLTQTSANRAPVADNRSTVTDEDTPVSGTLTATDVDGDPLTYAIVAAPAHGTITSFNAATGAFTYRPAFNYNGPDSFTFRASDGSLTSNVATVSLTVNPVNDAPFGSPINQPTSTNEDTPVSGRVTASDFENDPLTFSGDVPPEGLPAHGSVVINPDGTYTYTPAANFNGTDQFAFKVTDDKGAFGYGMVTVRVFPVNDAPVAGNDAYGVDEDGVLTVSAGLLSRLRMVSEPGDFIGQGSSGGTQPLVLNYTTATSTFSAQTNFDNGVEIRVTDPSVVGGWTLNFAAPGDVPLAPGVYTGAMRWPFQTAASPGLDVSGNGRGFNQLTGQFTVYDVAYGPGGSVTRFAATFVQQGLNFDGSANPPLSGAIAFNTTFGAAGGVLANDTDVDGDFLLTAQLVAGPAHGSLTLNRDGTFVYTPDANFNGTDSFTYRATDGLAQSDVATVTLTVRPVNDAPAAVSDVYSLGEDTPLTVAAPVCSVTTPTWTATR